MVTTKGKARTVMKRDCERCSGTHGWKLLAQEYKPTLSNRFDAILAGHRNPKDWKTGGSPFIDKLATWETAVWEYLKESGETVSDRCVP